MLEIVRNLVPLGILLAGVAGFFGLRSMKNPPQETAVQPQFPKIETEPLSEHVGGFFIDVDGLVVPFREISLPAEVSGRILYKSPDCEAGHYVRAPRDGERAEPLIRIDPQDYQLEVERLAAQVDQAQVAIEELEEDLRGTLELIELARRDVALRQRELDRARRLADVNSASEIERVERDELSARNALTKLQNQQQLLTKRKASLEASRRLAEAQLEKARLDLQRTEIYAPTDGMIVQEMVEQDNYVQKGTTLLLMEDTSRVEVTCNLRMDQLYWLWLDKDPQSSDAAIPNPKSDYELPRAKAKVKYELGGRQYVWDGHLARFDGVGLDEKTRTIPCRVVVDDPRSVRLADGDASSSSAPVGPPALLRGMYVTLEIEVDPRTEPGKQLFRIPQDALRPGERIWIDRDGVLRVIDVEFVRLVEEPEPGALIQLSTDDLRPGDQLIVSPLSEARDGMRLRPDDAETGTEVAQP